MPKVVLKDKEPGDSLGAAHVNKLNQAARVVMHKFPGAFSSGNESGQASPIPFTQMWVEVTRDVAHPDTPFVYKGRRRYYSQTDQVWRTDDDANQYDIDVAQIGIELFFEDVIQCYWDPQRGAFIPTQFINKMIFCRPDEDIDEDADGLCTFYKGLRDDPAIRRNYNGDVIRRYCFNADDEVQAGLDCLAIHHSLMGLDGATGFAHSFEQSGDSSASSLGSESLGSGDPPTEVETRVRYELVPLRCPV